MKITKGLSTGASIGAGLGLTSAFVLAAISALIALFANGGGLGDAVTAFVVVGFFAAIVGLAVGILFGATFGALLAATGLERKARWLTPIAMLMVYAWAVTGGTVINLAASESLTILAVAVLTLPVGWRAGRRFEAAAGPRRTGRRQAALQRSGV
jgi:hypothetical protein